MLFQVCLIITDAVVANLFANLGNSLLTINSTHARIKSCVCLP